MSSKPNAHTDKSKGNTKLMLLAATACCICCLGTGLGVGLGLGLVVKKALTPTHEVRTEVILAGNVADYTPSVQDAIASKVATEMGVFSSQVAITVTSASVRMGITVSFYSSEAANAGQATMATKVADTNAASAFLSTSEMSVTAESIAVAPTVTETTTSSTTTSTAGSVQVPGIGIVEQLSLITPKECRATACSTNQFTDTVTSPLDDGCCCSTASQCGSATCSDYTCTAPGSTRRHLDEPPLGRFNSRRLSTPPAQGAYKNDYQAEYLNDLTSDYINTPKMIICMVGAAGGNLMVNQGQYVAWSDENECDSSKRSDPSKAGAQQGGESGPSYVHMSITSTRDCTSEADCDGVPMIIKGHVKLSDANPNTQEPERRVYFYSKVSSAPTEELKNGAFEMDYTLVAIMNGQEMKVGRGTLSVGATGVAFAEISQFGQNPDERRVFVDNSNTLSGKGALSGIDPYTGNMVSLLFGNNEDYFCRKVAGNPVTARKLSRQLDGTTEACFNRDKAKGRQSVWRYGLYDETTGARFEMGQGGFPIKGEGEDDYGYASYWGVHMHPAPADGKTVYHADDASQVFTISKGQGKLFKNTKEFKTLNAINKVPFRFHNDFQVTVDGVPFQPHTDWEAMWLSDGGGSFMITGRFSCDQTGCNKKQMSVTLTALEVHAFNTGKWCQVCTEHSYGIRGWSEALGGGSILIDAAALEVTAASVGTYADAVSIYDRSLVLPGDTSVPTSLTCVSECAVASTIGTGASALNGGGSLFTPATEHGELDSAADAEVYSWDSSAYQLKDSTAASIGNSALSTDLDQSYRYGWGFSIQLVKASDVANLNCNGNKICGWQARSKLTEFYEWELGPREWHSSTFLKKNSDNTIVQFTPPLRPSFKVPNNPDVYGEFADSDMIMQYEGFGNLHGIPGKCFDASTNEAADCGMGTRYASAFTIPWGAEGYVTLTDGTKKWVKWLEREVRFKRELSITSAGQSITMGSAANLPAAPVLTGDANDPYASTSAKYSGAWSASMWAKSPAVVHGVKKTQTATSS